MDRQRQRVLFRSFSTFLVTNLARGDYVSSCCRFLRAYLTPAEYGVLTLFQALVQFTLPFTPMNVDAAVGVAYFRLAREHLPGYLSSALLAPLGTTALAFILSAAAAEKISAITQIPVWWVIAIPAFGLVQLVPNVVLKLFQIRDQRLAYAGFNLGLATLNITLSLVAVMILGWGWPGRAQGIFLSYFVFSLVGLAVLYKGGG